MPNNKVESENNHDPQLCINGCGFYANPNCNSMCSKCFKSFCDVSRTVTSPSSPSTKTASSEKGHMAMVPSTSKVLESVSPKDLVAAEMVTAVVPSGPHPTPTTTTTASPQPMSPSFADQTEQRKEETPMISEPREEPESTKTQKNKSRCMMCKAKVPLAKQTVNKCRCGFVYCDSHRFPDQHECEFDHVQLDKDILFKANPRVNEVPRGGRSFTRLE